MQARVQMLANINITNASSLTLGQYCIQCLLFIRNDKQNMDKLDVKYKIPIWF